MPELVKQDQDSQGNDEGNYGKDECHINENSVGYRAQADSNERLIENFPKHATIEGSRKTAGSVKQDQGNKRYVQHALSDEEDGSVLRSSFREILVPSLRCACRQEP